MPAARSSPVSHSSPHRILRLTPMDLLVLLLRILHVGGGIFWAGTLIFLTTLLMPSIRDAGPDGAKVMAQLQARNFLNIVPIVAILTVLSGIWLLWIVSAGFSAAYMGSPMGITLSVGMLVSLVALALGLSLVRPTAVRIGRIGAAMAAMEPGPERDQMALDMGRLRGKMARSSNVTAVLIVIVVIAMAIARYV